MKLVKLMLRAAAVLVYAAGALLGMMIFGLASWGDLEASLFDSAITQDGRIRVSCPIVIAENETGTIRMTIKNPSDKPIMNRVKFRATDGFVTLIQEAKERYALEVGEEKELEWVVAADDAAFGGWLILAKVRAIPSYPLVDRQGSCGILVFNLFNLTGNQTLILASTVSVLCLGTGLLLWWGTNKPLQGRKHSAFRAMLALAGLILIGFTVSVLGYWVVGGILFVIGILVVGAIIAFFISG